MIFFMPWKMAKAEDIFEAISTFFKASDLNWFLFILPTPAPLLKLTEP